MSGLKNNFVIEWEEYFMGVAFLAARRSKDPVRKVGACIVRDDNTIVGIGYNGFPRGCSDDEFPWGKEGNDELNKKYLYVCHAEANAIMNKNSADAKGCKMYVGLFPCNECAKLIIQSGIKEIIYVSDKNYADIETRASKRMLKAAGVTYRGLTLKRKLIEIDFNEINWKRKKRNELESERLKREMCMCDENDKDNESDSKEEK